MSALFAGLVTGLVDDAAIFPPGNLRLAGAVAAHLEPTGHDRVRARPGGHGL